jgi:hypothetical protein
MKNIRSILARVRLLSSAFALVVLLSALAATPSHAVGPAPICDDLCWGWTVEHGCTDCHHCCSFDNGSWECSGPTGNTDCGTGGPGY